MKNKKFVIVDKETSEIYRNKFNKPLPPMTQKQLEFYFGITIKGLEEYLKLYPVDKKHLCPICQQPLQINDTIAKESGYKWQCWYCDEDFYDTEAIKK